jgi:hypothetical protein
MNVFEEIPDNIKDAKHINRDYIAGDIRSAIEEMREIEESLNKNLDSYFKSGKLKRDDLNAYKKVFDEKIWNSDRNDEFKNYCKRVELKMDEKYGEDIDERRNDARQQFMESLRNYLFKKGLQEYRSAKKQSIQ